MGCSDKEGPQCDSWSEGSQKSLQERKGDGDEVGTGNEGYGRGVESAWAERGFVYDEGAEERGDPEVGPEGMDLKRGHERVTEGVRNPGVDPWDGTVGVRSTGTGRPLV